jgi:hypothetical protein
MASTNRNYRKVLAQKVLAQKVLAWNMFDGLEKNELEFNFLPRFAFRQSQMLIELINRARIAIRDGSVVNARRVTILA